MKLPGHQDVTGNVMADKAAKCASCECVDMIIPVRLNDLLVLMKEISVKKMVDSVRSYTNGKLEKKKKKIESLCILVEYLQRD